MRRKYKTCRDCEHFQPDMKYSKLDPCRLTREVPWKKTRKLEVPKNCPMYAEYCIMDWNKHDGRD